MITAENVQWKKAILLVMAVEEAAELIAVDRVVGCVEVQHDLLRWHGVGLKEQLDEEPFDSSCAADDLLVPAILVGPDGGQFEPIEGARERSISFGSRGDPCCSRKCLPLKMIPASRLVVRT